MASPPLFITTPPVEDVLRGDGPQVHKFFQERCRITKESLGGRSGELIKLRNWQFSLDSMLYARRPDGRRRHRRALLGLPRKNGKSAKGSGFGLHGLLWSGDGAEVYSCAADKDQAKIVFGVAKRMVEMDPALSKIIKPYRDVLEVPETGSIYRALSSEAFTKEGLNPSTVIFDELHAQPNDELYDVMSNSFGARYDPLMIMITTAGVKTDSSGSESICYRLYQYGVDVAKGITDDPAFFFAWWAAAEGLDPSLPSTWAAANPGYDDLIDPEDLEANYKQAVAKGTLNDFKTKRLNMWVSSSKAWLPDGWWDKCATLDSDSQLEIPSRGVVLGFDGSRSSDSTALVAVTIEHDPKVIVLGLWERPDDKSLEWQVPRAEVKDAIRKAFRDYNVAEFAYDEYLWQDAILELQEERPHDEEKFVAFPQSPTRFLSATQRFYELVQNRKIRHTGDPRLARHLGHAHIRTDERGARLVKDARNSSRKIDLAVATVMAVDRAAYWLSQDPPDTLNGIPIEDIHFVW